MTEKGRSPRGWGSSENRGPVQGDVPSRPEDSADDDRARAMRTSGQAGPEPHRAAHLSGLARMLVQAPYPATRADLVRFLEGHNAPGTHIGALRALPADVAFADAEQVRSALAEPERDEPPR